MRVISQDGTIDIPYEMVVIQRFEEDVYFLNRNLTGVEDLISDIRLAKYSTEEKAIKAMEMLREQYERLEVFKVLASGATEHMEKSLNYEELVKYNQSYREMNAFQFPKDDEVEV
jgi:hypothetical protein